MLKLFTYYNSKTLIIKDLVLNFPSINKRMSEKIEQSHFVKHDSSSLDLAFIMDCTGSMGSYIDNARESIKMIVEEIVSLEKSDVNLALIEYRDNPPQDTSFETRVHDFTRSIKQMRDWLELCQAQGGGDEPECVAEALHAALKLNWREDATKICILISDAPPHGINCPGDSFPNGSPNGIDPVESVIKLAEKSITLYSVGCEPGLVPYRDFFSSLAYRTGGQYVPLRNANLLAKVIIGGAVEEICLERLMSEVEDEVLKKKQEGVVDEKLLAEAVETRLNFKGAKTNQILLNNSNIEKASDKAINYSKINSLREIREKFSPNFDIPAYDVIPKFHDAASCLSINTETNKEQDIEYSIGRSNVSNAQSERLVQKALNRSKKY